MESPFGGMAAKLICRNVYKGLPVNTTPLRRVMPRLAIIAAVLLLPVLCAAAPAADHRISRSDWALYMSNQEFARADKSLNEAYRLLAKQLAPEQAKALRVEQKAWSDKREKDAAALYPKGSPLYLRFLMEEARTREAELRARTSPAGTAAGTAGGAAGTAGGTAGTVGRASASGAQAGKASADAAAGFRPQAYAGVFTGQNAESSWSGKVTVAHERGAMFSVRAEAVQGAGGAAPACDMRGSLMLSGTRLSGRINGREVAVDYLHADSIALSGDTQGFCAAGASLNAAYVREKTERRVDPPQPGTMTIRDAARTTAPAPPQAPVLAGHGPGPAGMSAGMPAPRHNATAPHPAVTLADGELILVTPEIFLERAKAVLATSQGEPHVAESSESRGAKKAVYHHLLYPESGSFSVIFHYRDDMNHPKMITFMMPVPVKKPLPGILDAIALPSLAALSGAFPDGPAVAGAAMRELLGNQPPDMLFADGALRTWTHDGLIVCSLFDKITGLYSLVFLTDTGAAPTRQELAERMQATGILGGR